MSARMPDDADAMLCVNGVGAHKLKQYGAAFLKAVKDFRAENPDAEALITDDFRRAPPTESDGPSDTMMATAALLKEGLDIEAAADARGLKPGTIVTHIEGLIEHGHSVDIAALIDAARLEEIAAVLRLSETAAIGPVVEHFNGRISYSEVRLARAWLAAEARKTDLAYSTVSGREG